MRWLTRKHDPAKPSDEAIQARVVAHSITIRADKMYTETDRLLEQNHFGERIRRIYAGEKLA